MGLSKLLREVGDESMQRDSLHVIIYRDVDQIVSTIQ